MGRVRNHRKLSFPHFFWHIFGKIIFQSQSCNSSEKKIFGKKKILILDFLFFIASKKSGPTDPEVAENQCRTFVSRFLHVYGRFW